MAPSATSSSLSRVSDPIFLSSSQQKDAPVLPATAAPGPRRDRRAWKAERARLVGYSPRVATPVCRSVVVRSFYRAREPSSRTGGTLEPRLDDLYNGHRQLE